MTIRWRRRRFRWSPADNSNSPARRSPTFTPRKAELDAHFEAPCARGATRWAFRFSILGAVPNGRAPRRRPCPSSATRIMSAYMPKVGAPGLDMMFRTATDAGQSRFRQRSRHGRKNARRPRLTADRHGDVRQFAFSRRQADRPVVATLLHLARHRPRSHRHAALRLRAGDSVSNATSIMRSTCRCISSSAATSIMTSPARASGTCWRAALAATAWRTCHHVRLGQSSLDDLSRGAAQELSRNARRGSRPAHPYDRPARALAPVCSMTPPRSIGARTDESRWSVQRSRGAARRGPRAALERENRGPQPARHRARRYWRWRGAA